MKTTNVHVITHTLNADGVPEATLWSSKELACAELSRLMGVDVDPMVVGDDVVFGQYDGCWGIVERFDVRGWCHSRIYYRENVRVDDVRREPEEA